LLTESSYELIDLFDLAAGVLGVSGPLWTLPPAVWEVVVRIVRSVDGRVDLGPLTPQSARLLGARFDFRSERARRELDWRPRPFEGVLGETVGWLREQGLLA
jgi:nucleoside-diphosphate-sugar epimerase